VTTYLREGSNMGRGPIESVLSQPSGNWGTETGEIGDGKLGTDGTFLACNENNKYNLPESV
jgi:hypothetical protein